MGEKFVILAKARIQSSFLLPGRPFPPASELCRNDDEGG
jgi:hypothetical protein